MKDMGPIPTGGDLSMESTHAKYVTHLWHSNIEDRGEGKYQELVGRDLSLHKRIVNGWKATEQTKYLCMTMIKEDDETYYRGTQNEGMYYIIELQKKKYGACKNIQDKTARLTVLPHRCLYS